VDWGIDLHTTQLLPLPLTVSCSSKIQIGFTFLVLAHSGSFGKGPLNGCVCVSIWQTVRLTDGNVVCMLCAGDMVSPTVSCLQWDWLVLMSLQPHYSSLHVWFVSHPHIVDAADIVYAGSMYWYGVRPSVCLSQLSTTSSVWWLCRCGPSAQEISVAAQLVLSSKRELRRIVSWLFMNTDLTFSRPVGAEFEILRELVPDVVEMCMT